MNKLEKEVIDYLKTLNGSCATTDVLEEIRKVTKTNLALEEFLNIHKKFVTTTITKVSENKYKVKSEI